MLIDLRMRPSMSFNAPGMGGRAIGGAVFDYA